ncbi:unnamed protein product, partial [Pipistrellus nathusii]
MNFPMLTFIICGLLISATKAGWKIKKCWKNDIGHCRKRCLQTERYKLLCMNKLNCCIPINFEEYTRKPLPPLFPTDIISNVTWDVPPTPITWPNDQVTYIPDDNSTGTEITTPREKVSTTALTRAT